LVVTLGLFLFSIQYYSVTQMRGMYKRHVWRVMPRAFCVKKVRLACFCLTAREREQGDLAGLFDR
jgi:hypothetical protein